MTRYAARPGSLARRGLVAGLSALALAATGLAVQSAPAQAAAPVYTVAVGSTGTFAYPTDTPASSFVDKDGTFHFQQSAALYGADDPRSWDFYTGTNFDDATFSSDISDAVNPTNPKDKNNDTTWRCNTSPTGREATSAPAGSGYAQKNYCDLVGTWLDPDTGDWYGLVHNEFTPQPFGDGLHYDSIDYAVSHDQGHTWKIKAHVLTSPYSTKRGDTAAFPEQSYYYGDGDPRLYVDAASGYFYVYYGSRAIDKTGGWKAFYEHVARAPMSAKMSPTSWHKYYAGAWTQPGVGGKESNLVPVDASNSRGYTAPSAEYKPTTPGTVEQQVAAGTAPATSPLFVMDIAWDAYLGVYIGEPQVVDQSGNAPQEFYYTTNLATQKWHRLGDTGSYHDASWYRWLVDTASKTSAAIVGKTFRRYCSIACDGSDGEYANITITGTTAKAPFNPRRTYRIADGQGAVLSQVPGQSTTVSWPSTTSTDLSGWQFIGTGDGAYTIANASTGQLLGVNSRTTAARAWDTSPTVTPEKVGGPSVGQQWFVVANTSPVTGEADGTYRLVNRYSGLVLGLPSASGAHSQTTPTRTWSGAGHTAAQQTLTIESVRAH